MFKFDIQRFGGGGGGVTKTQVDSYHPDLENIYGAKQAADQQLDYSGLASTLMVGLLKGAAKGAGYNYVQPAATVASASTGTNDAFSEGSLKAQIGDYWTKNTSVTITNEERKKLKDDIVASLTKSNPLGEGYDYQKLVDAAAEEYPTQAQYQSITSQYNQRRNQEGY